MDLGLTGWGVLVTGGAGGIGSATVRAFAAEGARVAVHYHRSRDAAVALAEEVGGVAIPADLRDEAQADRLATAAVEALGRLDACVANAGAWPREDVPLWQMSLDRWRATLESNLTATFLTCRSYLRHVATTGEGSLVLVASTAGVFGEAGHADYAAAKGALASGLLLSLKNEVVRVAPRARVNVVAPGWTVTPMTRDRLDQPTLDRVTATMALRKVGTSDDVARAVVMLSSPVSSAHLTGQVVTVAGGMEGRLLHPPGAAVTDASDDGLAPSRPVRVVLVDDSDDLRALLRTVMELEEDLEVVGEAANGREAVAVTVAAHPDVVLLDMTMPVMDGPDAAAEISRLAPGTRIVMLSGWSADEVRSRIGTDVTVVVKGMGPMEVIEAVRRVARRPGTEPA